MDENAEIPIHINVDRAVSLEALTLLLHETFKKRAAEGQRIVSVSHAVDHDDPEGKPYSSVLVTEPYSLL